MKRELAAQLTSGLAHDFANLLTISIGLQGRIGRTEGLPPVAADLARATLTAARRGGTLLNRIAAISGPREVRPKPADIAALLEELRLMAVPSLPEGPGLDIIVAGPAGRILIDAGSVQDALLNLILNARDAIGRQGGRIVVTARPVQETWLETVVTDTGPGFSDGALKRGLEPFVTTKGGAAGESFDQAMDVWIWRARTKLGEDPKSPRLIKTICGAGYIFLGDVVWS